MLVCVADIRYTESTVQFRMNIYTAQLSRMLHCALEANVKTRTIVLTTKLL